VSVLVVFGRGIRQGKKSYGQCRGDGHEVKEDGGVIYPRCQVSGENKPCQIKLSVGWEGKV